jgi:hypothetical protein
MDQQTALPQAGQTIQGPNGQSAKLPNLPSVDASLLPNPSLQEAAMGNLKMR